MRAKSDSATYRHQSDQIVLTECVWRSRGMWKMSHKLLDVDFKPEVQLHREDIQLLLACTEKDPPKLPHIKEEQEEFWTSQEGEQLQGLEEANITKFTITPVSIKREEDDDEETSQYTRLHQNRTEESRETEHLKMEPDGEDCGGSEPTRNFNPGSHLQPVLQDKTSQSSEAETDDSFDWEETREPQSGLSSLRNNEVPVNNMECNTGKTSLSSSECATSFGHKGHLQKHNGTQMGEKPFSCSVCGKRCSRKNSLMTHMRLHSEGKCFSCSVCKKTFQQRGHVVEHMRIHTGEKPFSCSFCGRGFAQSSTLTSHLRVHTGEKPFTCTVCKSSFSDSSTLSKHMRIHTGEKPFSCTVCGKRFAQHGHLRRHLSVHTGEKPFGCSVCDKKFTRLANVKKHKCIGESSRSK